MGQPYNRADAEGFVRKLNRDRASRRRSNSVRLCRDVFYNRCWFWSRHGLRLLIIYSYPIPCIRITPKLSSTLPTLSSSQYIVGKPHNLSIFQAFDFQTPNESIRGNKYFVTENPLFISVYFLTDAVSEHPAEGERHAAVSEQRADVSVSTAVVSAPLEGPVTPTPLVTVNKLLINNYSYSYSYSYY